MKFIKRIFRFIRLLLFAIMFAVCMVLGIIPILPKRKEESADEILVQEKNNEEDMTETILYAADRE